MLFLLPPIIVIQSVSIILFSDIDECLDAAFIGDVLCEDLNSQCNNNVGSYVCTCVPGFSLFNGLCQHGEYSLLANFNLGHSLINSSGAAERAFFPFPCPSAPPKVYLLLCARCVSYSE